MIDEKCNLNVQDLENLYENAHQATAKLHNWNILVKQLKQFTINIDNDTKSLLVAGDEAILSEILSLLYECEKKLDQQLGGKNGFLAVKKRAKKVKIGPDKALFIDSVDKVKSLESTKICLEYLLVGICKHFDLEPKQAAGLLTQNNKYLAHVLAKGLKGYFEPVKNFYTEVVNTTRHLSKLTQEEKQFDSLALVCAALRPGLLSKNLEIACLVCQVFSKLGNAFQKTNQGDLA